MKTKLRFSVDYAREFGSHPEGYKRIFKSYDVIENNEVIGKLDVEPEYHNNRFHAFSRFGDGFAIIMCNTRKEALNSIRNYEQHYWETQSKTSR